MGAKCWMVVHADGSVVEGLRRGDELDHEATEALVARLHPGKRLSELGLGDLLENPDPPEGEVWAAVLPTVTVVCTSRVALDRPSDIDPAIINAFPGRTTYVVAMHSVVDWFAFAVWDGEHHLLRSLSLAPDDGIIEDLGERRDFEAPYWAGEHAEDDDYPLPFHPLEFGEDALAELLGFCYEGIQPADRVDVEDVPLLGYRIG